MKKVLLITAGSIVLAGAVAFYTYQSMSKESDSVAVQETVTEENGEEVIEIIEENAEPVEKEFPDDMSEMEIQTNIHAMSHQKVVAEDKWGFLPMTQERIARLLEVVNASNFEHKALYKDILMRWAEGDFSQAHHEHNSIWELQGGTIGKATGILSAEEEKAFIEEHFDIE